MANGNNMPDWDEWKSLSVDQREYSKFKIIQDMNTRLIDIHQKCDSRQTECGKCFMSVKDAKWLTWGMRGLYVLIIAGPVVEIVKKGFL